MASSLDTRSSVGPPPVILKRGDHICVFRGYFWHHGLFVGGGAVIHVASDDGEGKQSAKVCRATLAEFAQGGAVRKVNYGQRLPVEESVARAQASLGRSGYHLGRNNCEHFASWCVTGTYSSTQVDNVSSGATFVGGATIAPHVGLGVVTGTGGAPAMSAPNLTSGLKSVGGGSAARGIGVLATAGALVGAGSMCLAFRDRPCLTAEERSARAAGRVGGVSGGALGVGAVLYSVGALGVSGYSAPGLSSGLAALGTPLGGGMVAGLAMAVVAPALVAGLFAVILYVIVRWLQSRSSAEVTATTA